MRTFKSPSFIFPEELVQLQVTLEDTLFAEQICLSEDLSNHGRGEDLPALVVPIIKQVAFHPHHDEKRPNDFGNRIFAKPIKIITKRKKIIIKDQTPMSRSPPSLMSYADICVLNRKVHGQQASGDVWEQDGCPWIISSNQYLGVPSEQQSCVLAVAKYHYFGGPCEYEGDSRICGLAYAVSLTQYMFDNYKTYKHDIKKGVRDYQNGLYPDFFGPMCDNT